MTNRIDVIKSNRQKCACVCAHTHSLSFPCLHYENNGENGLISESNKPIGNSILNIIVCGVDFEACQYNLIQWLTCRLYRLHRRTISIGKRERIVHTEHTTNFFLHFIRLLFFFSIAVKFFLFGENGLKKIFWCWIHKRVREWMHTKNHWNALKQFTFIKLKCLCLLSDTFAFGLQFQFACWISSSSAAATSSTDSVDNFILYSYQWDLGHALWVQTLQQSK